MRGLGIRLTPASQRAVDSAADLLNLRLPTDPGTAGIDEGAAPCPSAHVLILRRYYKVRRRRRGAPGQAEEVSIRIREEWMHLEGPPDLEDPPGEPGVELVFSRLPEQAGAGMPGAAAPLPSPEDPRECVAGLRDAFADVLAERIEQNLLGRTLATKDWDPAHTFPPVDAAQVIINVSNTLNDAISREVRSVAEDAGVPAPAADLGSGVVTGLTMGPIDKPVRKAAEVVELAGVVVGILTCQPALVIACTKVLVKTTIKNAISKAITEALSSPAALDKPSERVSAAPTAFGPPDTARARSATRKTEIQGGESSAGGMAGGMTALP